MIHTHFISQQIQILHLDTEKILATPLYILLGITKMIYEIKHELKVLVIYHTLSAFSIVRFLLDSLGFFGTETKHMLLANVCDTINTIITNFVIKISSFTLTLLMSVSWVSVN